MKHTEGYRIIQILKELIARDVILARLNQITGLFLDFEHCSQIEPHQYLVCFVEYWKNKNIEIWDEERKYLDKIDRHRRRKRGGEQKVKDYVCVMGMRNWGSRFLWDSIYIYIYTHTYSSKFNQRKRESWQMGAWKMLWGGSLNMPTTHQQKGGGHNKFKVGNNEKSSLR